MKKIVRIFLGTSLLALGSCSLLDTEPYDFVTPSLYYTNETEMNTALNGVYATMANTTLYGSDMLGRMGLSADIGYEVLTSDDRTVGMYDVSPSDLKVQAYWRDLYAGIGRANMLIKYINKPEDMDKATRDNIYGQALFLRAYYYFMLVVRFHNIPLILTVPEDGTRDNVQIPQSDIRDVYLQIIKDMEEAAPLVRTAAELNSPGRVSQSTVYGMLARVALNMAGYPVYEPGMYAKAKEYAQKVIDTGTHALNPSYEDHFLTYIQDKYDVKESLFEVEFWGDNMGTYTSVAGRVGNNNGILCSRKDVLSNGLTLPQMYGYSGGLLRATSYFCSLYEEGDLRRDWTIAPFEYTPTGDKKDLGTNYWVRCCGKFRRECDLNEYERSSIYTQINFPLLRYADVLLMWAEGVAADPANNDAADLAQAYEYVNQVRRRGYGLDIYTPSEIADLEPAGKTFLLDNIKDERARELGFELLRKDDLVRWNEFGERMRYLKQIVNSNDYTFSAYEFAERYYNNASDRDEVWPIPSYELGVNRRLMQNNGW